jgi:hypothetical protein
MYRVRGKICKLVTMVSSDEAVFQCISGGQSDRFRAFRSEMSDPKAHKVQLEIGANLTIWELRNDCVEGLTPEMLFSTSAGPAFFSLSTLIGHLEFNDGEKVTLAGFLRVS